MQLKPALLGTLLIFSGPTMAQQDSFFDGGFESGTFAGWTPGGENGGSASLAAKGTCYSANDTTAISFNGNQRSNYAALLRSNAEGNPDSIATLRSHPFPAGSAVYFSALSETPSERRNDKPVDLVVNILDSTGSIISEQPYRTAVIALSNGCPSTKRDAAFSVHSIDTHQLNGEIMIEFTQHTNIPGFGLFTLIDNVFTLPKGQIILGQSQPVAVAGSSVTSSGTLYLDPTRSFDPDDAPHELDYSWFINGEDSIRHLDLPCINVNANDTLSSGNHTATLYVNDSFHYAADSVNFVVPGSSTGNLPADDPDAITIPDPNNPLNNNPDVTLTTPTGEDAVTLTDPGDECDVDVSEPEPENPDNSLPPGEGGDSSVIDLNSGSDGTGFTTTFVIGDASVSITGNVSITLAQSNEPILSATIVIANPKSVDTLEIEELSIPSLNIPENLDGTTSITISQADADNPASTADFEQAIEAIRFKYVPSNGADTASRIININVRDGSSNSNSAQSLINIQS